MKKVDYNKHIWEGWRVIDFINELEIEFQFRTFSNKEQLKKWVKDAQPYYKKHIPDVYNHFLNKVNFNNDSSLNM
jgi:hypothetical protein